MNFSLLESKRAGGRYNVRKALSPSTHTCRMGKASILWAASLPAVAGILDNFYATYWWTSCFRSTTPFDKSHSLIIA